MMIELQWTEGNRLHCEGFEANHYDMTSTGLTITTRHKVIDWNLKEKPIVTIYVNGVQLFFVPKWRES